MDLFTVRTNRRFCEQSNVQLIEELYENFETGQIQPVIDALDENVEWWCAGSDIIPFSGTYYGKEGVLQFFQHSVDSVARPNRAVIEQIIAEENQVFVRGTDDVIVKATGQSLELWFIHEFTLENRKIVRFKEFFDTARAEAGMRG